jgi:hypothetical protein
MESKPMGRVYGSIPHFKGSKTGSADIVITAGQQIIATEKCRKGDTVIVAEKIDGSCMGVGKNNGGIIPLTRAGYHAITSPFKQHNEMFVNWVKANEKRFDSLLGEGERVVGEWMVVTHGIRYNLIHEPFVPFDLIRHNVRLEYELFERRIKHHDFVVPWLVHIGGAISIEQSVTQLGHSRHGAVGQPEGVVYRVEHEGKVDFLAKWVRPDFEPCKYCSHENGGVTTYNINYTKWAM